jgi:hypothetical protein
LLPLSKKPVAGEGRRVVGVFYDAHPEKQLLQRVLQTQIHQKNTVGGKSNLQSLTPAKAINLKISHRRACF